MPAWGSLRVRGEQLVQLPFRHLHKSGGASFPEQAGAPPTRHPRAPLPWALHAPVPAQELLPRWSRAARRKSRALTHPFDEEALLQHSSFFLHRGRQGTEQSPRRELPAPWLPVPLHMICLRKLIFLCSPPPTWRTLPALVFFSSLPTCETLVKQATGSDMLPAFGEVKQRDV